MSLLLFYYHDKISLANATTKRKHFVWESQFQRTVSPGPSWWAVGEQVARHGAGGERSWGKGTWGKEEGDAVVGI